MQLIDRTKLLAVLEKIDNALSQPQELCVIGSCALLLMGNSARSTVDIDIWAPASRFDRIALERACNAAGIGFDPIDDEPAEPYLQIVKPGIVALPARKNNQWAGGGVSTVGWKGRMLTIVLPPASALAASKLVRCESRDLDDCGWLIATGQTTADACEKSAAALPRQVREAASENVLLLRLAA
jgi:hypothetical protein